MAKRKRTTYRSEFASLPPPQRKHELSWLDLFLDYFLARRPAGEERLDELQRPRPVPRRRGP